MTINRGVPVNFAPEETYPLIASLFASSMDGLAFITPDYKIRYANELMTRMVNIPLEKMLGNPIEQLIPGWANQMDVVYQKVRLTGESFTTDFYPYFFENQPERGITYWKGTLSPVIGIESAFLGWVLVLREVTKYRQTEAEKVTLSQDLENKITLLNGIIDNSPAGLAMLDGSSLTIKWANKRFSAFWDRPCQLSTFEGLSFIELIPPDQKNNWVAMFHQVVKTGISVYQKLIEQRPNYWNCSIIPIFTQAAIPDLLITFYDITEKIASRKLIEEYARQADQHLQQLETVIENMSDGVIIFELDSKILNVNSAALKFMGYANRRECPAYLSQIHNGLILYDLEGNVLPIESWPSNQIMRGHIVRDFKAAGNRIDSSVLKYASYNGALVKDANHDTTIAMMTIHDITEREMLIRELEQKQAHLQAVLEQMPCGVIMFDVASGKTVLTNKKYTEIWHVSSAGTEMGKQNCPGDFFHPDGRPYLDSEVPIMRSINYGEIIANEEIICRRQDGSWMVAICNSAPILDRDGKIVAGVVVFSDITELKEATTKAALTNQLQQIIEFLPDGTFVVDQNRKVIAWNRVLELLTGISKAAIIGTDFYKGIFNDDNQESLIDRIFKGISVCLECSGEAAVQQILLPVLNQRENVLLDLKATPIRNEQGEVTGVIETIRDITQQKQMEADAIRMQKLDSLGILAGGIAHDFNNILAVILANLQLVALKLSHREDVTKYLDGTIETTRKASDLTRQLLTFAKGGAPVKKTASILELITDTVEFALRGSKVKAKFHFQENPWAVEIDEGQITQVINNLTINAVQAMPRGGFLEITFENIVLLAESKYRPGRYVKLSIRDFGCGIPADIIDKIFDPFFTTKEVGNGLGLSTSYSIIKRHNGYIEVESSVGTGATFFIYLPASDGVVVVPEVSPQVAAVGEYKILFMDDDEMIRQVVGDMLVYNGYRITVAKDGNETIDFYRRAITDGEKFDVVIMDLTVPGGMGGLDAMAVLRQIDPQVKAIISSGYANDLVLSDYKQYGFYGFVAKPYKFDELIEVLNMTLHQK